MELPNYRDAAAYGRCRADRVVEATSARHGSTIGPAEDSPLRGRAPRWPAKVASWVPLWIKGAPCALQLTQGRLGRGESRQRPAVSGSTAASLEKGSQDPGRAFGRRRDSVVRKTAQTSDSVGDPGL